MCVCREAAWRAAQEAERLGGELVQRELPLEVGLEHGGDLPAQRQRELAVL